MTAVDLYVASHRGRAVLEGAITSGIEIRRVIVEDDPTVTDNGYQEIMALCGRTIPFSRKPPDDPAPYAVAAGWRHRIDHPRLYVLHDSLLPKLRGFAPLITALIEGHREVGVTCFRATGEMDAGPVVFQRMLPVEYPKRIGDLLRDTEPLYNDLARSLCARLAVGAEPSEHPQEGKVTYSQARDASDYRIDWSLDAERLERFVDAVSEPYLGAITFKGDHPVRVWEARAMPDRMIEDRRHGRVLTAEPKPVVVCGTGLLRLDVYAAQVALNARSRFE